MLGPLDITVFAHIALGTLAVVAGAVALGARKGRKTHISAGRVFAITMGLASVFGALLGAYKFEEFWITFHAGILGATLVASGVLAVRPRTKRAQVGFVTLAGINALNAAGLLTAGWYATSLPEARLFGFAAADYFFLFGMAALATIGDIFMMLRAQITARHRIAQHLIRMCTGFFIAAGSAFTGPGAAAFPESVQNSGVLSLPELSIFVLMLYWLWQTLRPRKPLATA